MKRYLNSKEYILLLILVPSLHTTYLTMTVFPSPSPGYPMPLVSEDTFTYVHTQHRHTEAAIDTKKHK